MKLWAKAPHVFILNGEYSAEFRDSTKRILAAAGVKTTFHREEVKDKIPRQLWRVGEKSVIPAPVVRFLKSKRRRRALKAGCVAFFRAPPV